MFAPAEPSPVKGRIRLPRAAYANGNDDLRAQVGARLCFSGRARPGAGGSPPIFALRRFVSGSLRFVFGRAVPTPTGRPHKINTVCKAPPAKTGQSPLDWSVLERFTYMSRVNPRPQTGGGRGLTGENSPTNPFSWHYFNMQIRLW